MIKTQRPTHPPLERNSEDHIEKSCDPKCYISKQTHHDDLMSELSCILSWETVRSHITADCAEYTTSHPLGQPSRWSVSLARYSMKNVRNVLGIRTCARNKKKNIAALTPNRCRKFQLYFSLRQRRSFRHPSLHLLTSVGDKCKLMRPKEPRVGDKSGRQVWETSVGDKCERQVLETSVEDKWETSVNSCAPRHPEWETRVGDKWETSVNPCRPRHPEWETSGGDKGETSVNSCGPRNPERETSVEDKCGRQGRHKSKTHATQGTQSGRQGGDKWKLMRPKEARVGDKCGRQVWETSGRQV